MAPIWEKKGHIYIWFHLVMGSAYYTGAFRYGEVIFEICIPDTREIYNYYRYMFFLISTTSARLLVMECFLWHYLPPSIGNEVIMLRKEVT